MKTNPTKKIRTFGEFVTRAYDVYGKRKGSGFVQLAIHAHLIEFCGQKRFEIS